MFGNIEDYSKLPLELMFGIDVAIKKLRPNAELVIEGTNIRDYFDPTGLPEITWQDIMDQIMKDKAAADAWLANQPKN